MHDCLKLTERIRLDRLQCRDAGDNIGLLLFGKLTQNIGAKAEIKIGDDKRDDLRMLVENQLSDRTGIHPVKNLDWTLGTRRSDPAKNRLGFVLAKSTGHDIADIIACTKTKACLLLDDRQKFIEDLVDRILVKALYRIHSGTKMLHLAW